MPSRPCRLLLATDLEGGRIQILGTASGQVLQTLAGHPGRVDRLVFRPDGRYLASIGTPENPKQRQWEIRVWAVATGRKLWAVAGHTEYGGVLAYRQGGRQLVSAGHQTVGKSVRPELKSWDAATGRELDTLQLDDRTPFGLEMVLSLDGRRVGLYGRRQDGSTKDRSREWRVWDTDARRMLFAIPGEIGWPAFTADGKFLTGVPGGNPPRFRWWDATTGEAVASTPVDRSSLRVVLSPDGRRLATTDQRQRITLWDTRSGFEVFSLAETGDIGHLLFSADGDRLVSILQDGTIQVRDASAGLDYRPIFAHLGTVRGLGFDSQSQYLIAVGGTGATRAWELHTGTLIPRFKGTAPPATGRATSPDGQLLAEATPAGTVTIKFLPTGRVLSVVRTPGGPVTALAFSPDSRWLAAAAGGRIGVWSRSGLFRRTESRRRFWLRQEIQACRAAGRPAAAAWYSRFLTDAEAADRILGANQPLPQP
jgi:WD40 repeat protein